MNWFKRDPLLVGLIGVVCLSMGGESWWLWRVHAEALRATSFLAQTNRERDDLRTRSPAPTEENEQTVDRDLASARTRLAGMETALRGADKRDSGVSAAKPTDVYFQIASFVEKTRSLAIQSHVSIHPDERFGFASHAGEGPAVDVLPAVMRQLTATGAIMEALLAAQPVALVSVQREHLVGSTPHTALGDPADFFEFAPALSLRKPGMLETDAFKVEFTAQTRVLREFVNRILSSDSTFAVRMVEVEPVSAAVSDAGTQTKSTGVLPIVVEGLSRFRVVVERMRPAVESGKDAR